MEASVSKGEFAAIIGVSPGRVSQYLAEGKISSAALVGSGRNAKIDVERAKADLRLTLDVAQRLGNGIETRIDAAPVTVAAGETAVSVGPAHQAPSGPSPIALTGIDHEIKQQKLEQIRRANRNGAIADAQARGQLIETEAARAEMARVASSMLLVFEGGMTDLASAVASEFKIPQRDVLHLLRRELRTIRASAAKQMAAMALTVDETIATPLDAEDIETIN